MLAGYRAGQLVDIGQSASVVFGEENTKFIGSECPFPMKSFYVLPDNKISHEMLICFPVLRI